MKYEFFIFVIKNIENVFSIFCLLGDKVFINGIQVVFVSGYVYDTFQIRLHELLEWQYNTVRICFIRYYWDA